MSIGNLPEVLSRPILAGIILVGRSGVEGARPVSVLRFSLLESYRQVVIFIYMFIESLDLPLHLLVGLVDVFLHSEVY